MMGVASRKVGAGGLTLHGMLSFEPFTLRDLGSSQVFQTGETFGGAPLIDYQHPHDLIMGLSAAYERPIARARRCSCAAGWSTSRRSVRLPSCIGRRRTSTRRLRSRITNSTRRTSRMAPSPPAFARARGSSKRRRFAGASRTRIGRISISVRSIRIRCAGSWIRGGHARTSVGRLARGAARYRARRRHPDHGIGRARRGSRSAARRSGDVRVGSEPPHRQQRDGLLAEATLATVEARHRLPARRARRQTHPRRRRRPPAGRSHTRTSSRALVRSLLATPTNSGAMRATAHRDRRRYHRLPRPVRARRSRTGSRSRSTSTAAGRAWRR